MARDTRDFDDKVGDTTVRDRVEELTWSLMDQEINDDELRLLDTLLLSDDTARETYLGCVHLHTDLMFHFADQSAKTAGGEKTPVIGFFADAVPPTGVQPPVSEPNSRLMVLHS